MENLSNKDLPRICYVLGGEKTPLKIGEEFEFKNEKYGMEENGIYYGTGGILWALPSAILEMINHPEKIVRRLQFSEDEKAFMRLLVKSGIPWVARDQDGAIYIFSKKPAMVLRESDSYFCDKEDDYLIPTKLFPQITFESSPVNCLDYVSENG